jgi:hypothetical protein
MINKDDIKDFGSQHKPFNTRPEDGFDEAEANKIIKKIIEPRKESFCSMQSCQGLIIVTDEGMIGFAPPLD